MARARNIKPSFFTNEELVELPFEFRLLFIGLWTLADREGRLEDRPKRIKMAIFPADNVDVDAGLSALQESGFILRYAATGIRVIQVLNFAKHQNPHIREAVSELPSPDQHSASTVQAPDQHSASHADSLNPYSLNPESGEQAASTTFTGVAREEPPPAALPDEPRKATTPEPEPTRRGIVCRLLRQAGVSDAAPHQLTDETWDQILGKRTNEEIVEFAKTKVSARQGLRTSLRYLAPGLLEDPQPISTGPPAGARASPRGMTREESRRIAASTRLSDFRAACAAEQQEKTDDDSRTIDAGAADTRLLG